MGVKGSIRAFDAFRTMPFKPFSQAASARMWHHSFFTFLRYISPRRAPPLNT